MEITLSQLESALGFTPGPVHPARRERVAVITVRMTPEFHERIKDAVHRERAESMNVWCVEAILCAVEASEADDGK
jgi:predicted HicB family RNase H-like nuclease